MLKRAASSTAADEYAQLLARADASVATAAALAARDPNRPGFHVLPPANWINDPNGPIFHNGEFHLFYQHNPYGPVWGNMSWGHVVSRDMVYWQHLPIALVPEPDGPDREGVFSGSCIVYRDVPRILYTGVFPEVQCLATGDARLRTWTKSQHNPAITHAPDEMTSDFRDPFCWHHGNWCYMVLGSRRKNGGGCVLLYRTHDFETWEYLGILHEGNGCGKVFECPNFFQMGSKWVLVVSPYADVEYAVGSFNESRFIPDGPWRVLDFGGNGSFYAPNSLADPHGRRIMWGWIREAQGRNGSPWAGCLSLPRVLNLASDGQLGIEPLPELAVLRKTHHAWENLALIRDLPQILDVELPDMLEITAEIEVQKASRVVMELARAAGDIKPVTVEFAVNAGRLTCNGKSGWFKLPTGENCLRLHIYLDRTVLEVYANNRAVITTVLDSIPLVPYPDQMRFRLSLLSRGGNARIAALNAWELGSIWVSAIAEPPATKEKRFLKLGNLFSS